MKIATVVVTYNRKNLVLECMNAILKQTYKVNRIFLIDNNSTDGTYEYLKENKILDEECVVYKKLEKNIGGAGGFFEGMKMAREENFDWVWVMDDDTIPNSDCLENLLKAKEYIKEDASFLASNIYGENMELINSPTIDHSVEENGGQTWYRYLVKGIVAIKEATFVSILINGKAIKKCGLPLRDYFIWGDDIEYTTRIYRNFGKAYLVGNSIVIHKLKGAKRYKFLYEEDKKRINMYYYSYRNNLINASLYRGIKGVLKQYIKAWIMCFRIIFSKSKYKIRKIAIIHKGILHYIFKRYDYKAVKNRFYI